MIAPIANSRVLRSAVLGCSRALSRCQDPSGNL